MSSRTMRRPLLLTTLALTLGATLAATRAAPPADEAAVRHVAELYLRGHATGDGEHYRQIFHPESKLFWVAEGQLRQRSSAEYIAGAPGKPAADEAQRKRWIESVDITGNAAVVKVVLDYPNAKLTDYLSMLEIDGRWWIVNKTFVRQAAGS